MAVTEIHTMIRKCPRGWFCIVDDRSRMHEDEHGYGFYLSRLCDGSTAWKPQYFGDRESARDAMRRFNELNAGQFNMIGGLH